MDMDKNNGKIRQRSWDDGQANLDGEANPPPPPGSQLGVEARKNALNNLTFLLRKNTIIVEIEPVGRVTD